jgi:hypothetical protein
MFVLLCCVRSPVEKLLSALISTKMALWLGFFLRRSLAVPFGNQSPRVEIYYA